MTVMEDHVTTTDGAPADGAVPTRLSEPLKVVAGRARMLAWLHGLFKLFALVAVVWLAVALLMGTSLRVPLWVGVPLTVAAWAVVIVGAYRILRTLFRRKGGLAAAAWLADEALPESEERISSAVELAQEPDGRFKGSPELVAVLTRQAEHHADTMDPANVISGRDVMRWLTTAGMTLLVWFVLLVVFTPNMLLGMQRMFQPWKAAAALPEPMMEVEPGDKVLAQGADLQVKVVVHPAEGLSLDMGKVDRATIVQHFVGAQGGVSPDLAQPMDCTLMTDTQAFAITFRSVQQSFTYKIVAEGNTNHMRVESPEYTVTVQTRPAVADVEVQYTYPPYTGLNPYTEHSREGTISALVGTKARVLIHTTEPVKTAQILLEDDGMGGGARTMDLVRQERAATGPEGATGGNQKETVYATELTIRKNTTYQVKLAKEDGRENTDTQSRSIKALPDNKPTITIVPPDPRGGGGGALRVRPEDTVPMKYVATDDFGVVRVEAVVSVDGGPEASLSVPLPGGAEMQGRVTGDYDMALPYVLKTATHPVGAAAEPKSVTYFFRATDNCEPMAQTGISTKQTLVFDKAAPPLAQRLDTQAVQQMAAAIRTALEDLKNAQQKLQDVSKSDTDKALSAANRQAVGDAQKSLKEAGQLLRQAADQADSSRLTDLSKQVREIADGPVKAAEEDAVKAALASDQPEARKNEEASAGKNTQDAIDRLTKLSDTMKTAVKDQPLAQKLEDLAQRQQQLAQELAKNPNDPALREKQRQLQAELDQVIKDNPQLQKPAADANENKLRELARQVQQLEKDQQPLTDSVNSVNDAAKIADKAAELAKKQEELNGDINRFASEKGATLRQAGTSSPDAGKLDPIVKELQDNKLSNAVRDQKAATSALEQAADKLEAAEKKAQQNTATRPAASPQAVADVAQAEKLQQDAQKLAQDIQQAKNDGNPPSRPGDAANQTAQKLADSVKQLARQMQNRTAANSQAKKDAQAADKEADAAKAAAAQGQAEQAQQHLNNAANQLAQAARENAPAGNANTPTGPQAQEARQAADAAQKLADRQKELADETAALSKAQQDAANAKARADTTANQQRELANRINQTKNNAQDLQQQTQGPAPEMAGRAGKASDALQKASQAQQEAAKATAGGDARTAAARQNEAAEQLAQAEEALTGKPPQPGRGNSGGQANPGGSTAGGQATGGDAGGTAGDATNGAAQSVQGARQSQAQAIGGNSAAAQRAGEQLAEASRQLRSNGGNPNANSGQAAGGSGQPSGTGGQNGTGGRQGGTGAADNGGSGVAGGQGSGSGGRGTGSGGQGTGSGGQGSGTGGRGGTPGSGGTGGSGGGGGGVTLTDGRPLEVPKEVQETGLSPSDWIKLPPEMQEELLHSAQQPGPPGYRDMIKNYYSRIARMQNQSGNTP